MSWMNDMKERMEGMLKELTGTANHSSVLFDSRDKAAFERKQRLLDKRKAEIVKGKTNGQIFGQMTMDNQRVVTYGLHREFLVKQGEEMYLEEEIEFRKATIEGDEVVTDVLLETEGQDADIPVIEWTDDEEMRQQYVYDRLAAVRYAERWWNSYNPRFRKFDVDCTNYVSQCLLAGGAPMRGYPNRSNGWWYRNNNWSYSWAVAHSLRWYLSGSKTGLRGRLVQSPEELQPGDVICYDFEGDGRFDHNTIVIAKDGNGMPLVNAHTNNSRMRYWSYEDSAAYTPNIVYKFFQIVDDQ